MSYDEKTVERIRRVLAGRRDIAETYMMGGLSFMVSGSMCCRVSKRGFLIRVTPETREHILAMPHAHPPELAGRRMSAFVAIAPDGYRTDDALASWVQRGIENAIAAAARKDSGKTLAGKIPSGKTAGKTSRAKATRAKNRTR